MRDNDLLNIYKDQNYKGYSLFFSADSRDETISLKIEKNGKTFSITRNSKIVNLNVYETLIKQAVTIIDFIDYQVKEELRLNQIRKNSEIKPIIFDDRECCDSEDNQEQKSEIEIVSKTALDWFNSTDLNRYLDKEEK